MPLLFRTLGDEKMNQKCFEKFCRKCGHCSDDENIDSSADHYRCTKIVGSPFIARIGEEGFWAYDTFQVPLACPFKLEHVMEDNGLTFTL